MAGRVEHITFAEGKPVKMGQVLVQIDNAELRANLQKSQARLKLAASQEVRVKQQLDAGAASTKEYEQVSAERSQAEADVALLKAQLAKTQIIAPFSGVAGLLPIYPGTFVQPGTRVTTLQDLSRIKLEFSVPEQEAWRIHQGIKVQFLATGRTDSMEADIYAVEPRLDATTRSLTVRAYAKSSHDLIPGGFAEVILTGGGVDSALVVPPAAITMAGAGALVFVVQQGKAMPHPVRLGGRTPDAVQILSGAKLGDTVITSGFMALKPGSPVAIRSVN
jgi:membrane fusion protein, multidrug efflux system